MNRLLVGVDLDNTIACFDRVFHDAAVESDLVPASVAPTKERIRDHLRATGRETIWTELQGRVYGPLSRTAPPFPGVLDFFAACARRGVPVRVISHRTRTPFLGPPYDLHAAARDWLEQHGFHDPKRGALPRDAVFLEPTKADKLERIRALGCTHFIDDLPEFLSEPSFPAGVQRILFDPNRSHTSGDGYRHAPSWAAVSDLVLADAEVDSRGRRSRS